VLSRTDGGSSVRRAVKQTCSKYTDAEAEYASQWDAFAAVVAGE